MADLTVAFDILYCVSKQLCKQDLPLFNIKGVRYHMCCHKNEYVTKRFNVFEEKMVYERRILFTVIKFRRYKATVVQQFIS